jgi:hypothetical protein
MILIYPPRFMVNIPSFSDLLTPHLDDLERKSPSVK